MITKPPPYASAPTLNATHTSPPRFMTAEGRSRSRSSIAPHATRTRTTHAPTSADAAAPATAYASHRARLDADDQDAGTRVAPARTATAATAAPAPAAAPRIHRGGDASRKTTASAMMSARPGTMKAAPPTTAPTRPRSRQAQ